MADTPEEVLLTLQPRPRRKPLPEPTPDTTAWLRPFQKRKLARSISAMMAAYYRYGVGPTGRRHTFRSIAVLFEIPTTTTHRMIASVSEEEAMRAAQRFGLILIPGLLDDLPQRGSSSQLMSALGTEERMERDNPNPV